MEGQWPEDSEICSYGTYPGRNHKAQLSESGQGKYQTQRFRRNIHREQYEQQLHSYLALNPKNAEEALISLSNQISLAMKHIEMINEELMEKQ